MSCSEIALLPIERVAKQNAFDQPTTSYVPPYVQTISLK